MKIKRGRLFCKCEVSCGDIFALAEGLHRRGVSVFDLSNAKDKTILWVDYVDSVKLFAISRNMCYNIRVIGYRGMLSPLVFVWSKLGIFLGALCFIVACFAFEPVVCSIEYRGDGLVLKRQIEEVLVSEGISVGCRLDNQSAIELSKKITISSEDFSFVTTQKSGHRLIIEAYRTQFNQDPLNLKRQNLLSSVSGKVAKVNCMSGTLKVAVGDSVKAGDLLVEGCYTLNGEQKPTYVLAEIAIEKDEIFVYEAAANSQIYKNRAETVAKEHFSDREIISLTSSPKKVEGGWIYEVTVKYLVIEK